VARVTSGNRLTAMELTEPAIARLTVVEAIQRLRPNWMRSRGEITFSLTEFEAGGAARGVPVSCGAPNGVQQRSCSAFDIMAGRNPPGVIVDGIPQPFEIMESMSPTEIVAMEFLSAVDATTLYGTGYTNGAIVITTQARQR
jgi:hypothetical protein